MKKIIDISVKSGLVLWAEEEGDCSDFRNEEEGYLFSIELDGKNNCRTFYKDYPKGADENNHPILYISLTSDGIDEGDWATNFNEYVEANIIRDNYCGDYVRHNYLGSLIVDMKRQVAKFKNEDGHFAEIIKIENQDSTWQKQHEDSFTQPY